MPYKKKKPATNASNNHQKQGDICVCNRAQVRNKNDAIAMCEQPQEVCRRNETTAGYLKPHHNVNYEHTFPLANDTMDTKYISDNNTKRHHVKSNAEYVPKTVQDSVPITEYTDIYARKKATRESKPPAASVTGPAKQGNISPFTASYNDPHIMSLSGAYRSPVSIHIPTDKFDVSSSYNDTYVAFPVQKQEVPICSQKPKFKPPVEQMTTQTIYQDQFTNPMVASQKIRMRSIIKCGDEEDECQSTYNSDYQLWRNVPAKKSFKNQAVYKQPTETFLSGTNYAHYYQGKREEKARVVRPKDQLISFAAQKDSMPNPCPKYVQIKSTNTDISKQETRSSSVALPVAHASTPANLPVSRLMN